MDLPLPSTTHPRCHLCVEPSKFEVSCQDASARSWRVVCEAGWYVDGGYGVVVVEVLYHCLLLLACSSKWSYLASSSRLIPSRLCLEASLWTASCSYFNVFRTLSSSSSLPIFSHLLLDSALLSFSSSSASIPLSVTFCCSIMERALLVCSI